VCGAISSEFGGFPEPVDTIRLREFPTLFYFEESEFSFLNGLWFTITSMPSFKTLTDTDLLLHLQLGDSTAYTEIYERYYYLMFVFAYKKLRDEDLAKDIIQELFTNLWEKKESLSSVKNLASYLFTAVRNKIFDFISHQHVKSKHLQAIAAYSSSIHNANTDYLVRENQLKAYINKAIDELPSKMKEIFELSRKSDLTYKEIAEKLSLSERTVNNQVSNALSRLRTKLGLFIFIAILYI
jgi:RNA polymerase sigma-70 factor (family 1)